MPIPSGLVLPRLLRCLLKNGEWIHPGDDIIAKMLPVLKGEDLDFCKTFESIDFNSGELMSPNEDENFDFHEYRGSRLDKPRDLPWIDVEKSIFIAVCRTAGEDNALALDYRTSRSDPRVICTDWHSGGDSLIWVEICPTFSEFWSWLKREINTEEQVTACKNESGVGDS